MGFGLMFMRTMLVWPILSNGSIVAEIVCAGHSVVCRGFVRSNHTQQTPRGVDGRRA